MNHKNPLVIILWSTWGLSWRLDWRSQAMHYQILQTLFLEVVWTKGIVYWWKCHIPSQGPYISIKRRIDLGKLMKRGQRNGNTEEKDNKNTELWNLLWKGISSGITVIIGFQGLRLTSFQKRRRANDGPKRAWQPVTPSFVVTLSLEIRTSWRSTGIPYMN